MLFEFMLFVLYENERQYIFNGNVLIRLQFNLLAHILIKYF